MAISFHFETAPTLLRIPVALLRGCFSLILQPLIQPAEESALPQDAVLGFQYPVVFVGEDEQFGGHASQFRRIECRHALRGEDAEIFFAVDAEDRRVPFIYEKVRRIGVAALHGRIVLFPVRAAQVPVGEPKLFGFQVLLLHVEESVVCDECLEAFVVMPGKPVHRIASEAGSYASQPVFVYVRFLRDVVYRAQVICLCRLPSWSSAALPCLFSAG